MTAHIFSATTLGYDGKLVVVECDASNGLPSLQIVGLGGKAIDEARERVRSAIKNSGLDFPRKRITINLAPANLPKSGTHLDLPIALALLQISGQLPPTTLKHTMVVGELGLDGTVRPIRGIINHVQTALENKLQKVILPAPNYEQATLVEGLELLPVSCLRDLLHHLINPQAIKPPTTPQTSPASHSLSLDDIQGQEQAKRALVIAAAGNHNILLNGPPGTGKTMLAKTILSLLPAPQPHEVIEITKLHSLAGEIEETVLSARPFRSPHHSASHIAIVGGGPLSKPGEVSLARRGVLFLDELPEYNRQTLEALRQPLEDKVTHIARAESRASYPADCLVIATQNPCPCGYLGDTMQSCSCSAHQIATYQKRVSGPLLDRMDLFITLSRVNHEELLRKQTTSNASYYQKLIETSRKQQARRFGNALQTNASLASQDLQDSGLEADAKNLLNQAATQLNLTARAYFKVIKVARTIADLEACHIITSTHISEALQYRYRKEALFS